LRASFSNIAAEFKIFVAGAKKSVEKTSAVRKHCENFQLRQTRAQIL